MNEDFYLLIAGSRSFDDYKLLKEKCDEIIKDKSVNIHIVNGGARGADSLASLYARENNYEVRVFPAKWDKYGKSAGYIRNEEMHQYISKFKNRACICFWDGSSKGTKHNFYLCKKYNTQLYIINYGKE